MDTNRIKAFVRSVFPFLESSLAALIARRFGHVSPATASYVLGLGGLGLSAVLHWLEGHFPWVGVFLGWLGAPKYAPAVRKVLSAQLDQAQAQLQSLQSELDAWKSAKPATGTATLSADGTATP